jgi:cysteinyl-tRNA synthetase
MDESSPSNAHLLENVALYMTKILSVFGALPSNVTFGFPVASEGVDRETAVIPFASLVADFREEVRQISLHEKCK